MKQSNIKNRAYWLIPFICVLIAVLLSLTPPLQRLELYLLDSRFQLRGESPDEPGSIQLVAIDDQTFFALDRPWPFNRSLYAKAINNLNRAGADLIVLDVEFFEPNRTNPAQDSILAKTIEDAGNVILASKLSYAGIPGTSSDYITIKQPLGALAKDAKGVGLVNEITDMDGVMRRGFYHLDYQNQKIPTLLSEILRNTNENNRLSSQHNSFEINYRGPTGTFPAISFSSVLDDAEYHFPHEIDSDYMEQFYVDNVDSDNLVVNPFRDKIILIGATAPDLHDLKLTPVSSGKYQPMSGIEVLANAVSTCLAENPIKKSSFSVTVLLSLLLGFFATWSVFRLDPKIVILLILSCLAGLSILAYTLFVKGTFWLNLTTPGTSLFLSYSSAVAVTAIRDKKEKSRLRSLFAHYVPRRIIANLVENPASLKLGGERREVTILFADIENFTSSCENISPEEMVRLLNQYMTEMTRIIQQEGGIIDKYEGDAIMAEFGVPVPFKHHADHACNAALRMQGRLAELGQIWRESGYPELRTRIGINTGQVIVGNMGSTSLFDYTVLGSEVNLCSRLEKANKLYKTRILISDSTRSELSGNFVTRTIGDIDLRGRSDSVRIHELLSSNLELIPLEDRQLLDIYNKAWSYLEQEDYAAAVELFEKANELEPTDLAIRINLEKCRRLALTLESANLQPS